MESKKNDIVEDKLKWNLLPLSLIKEVVKVFHFGASKYSENSWQGLENGYERYKSAMFRHLVAYEEGEIHDTESGLHHLSHMAWNALAMMYFALKEKPKPHEERG